MDKADKQPNIFYSIMAFFYINVRNNSFCSSISINVERKFMNNVFHADM